MDGTCDFPRCTKDATEEFLSGPDQGKEFCAKHVDFVSRRPLANPPASVDNPAL